MARTRSKGKPVSGPGAQSQRTDLSPAGQPIRVASGGKYGQRQALTQQQQAAPLASGQDPLARRVDAANAPQVPDAGVFGPTQRPNEPITAGIPYGPGQNPAGQPTDPDIVLQVLSQMIPHPEIYRLMRAGNP